MSVNMLVPNKRRVSGRAGCYNKSLQGRELGFIGLDPRLRAFAVAFLSRRIPFRVLVRH